MSRRTGTLFALALGWAATVGAGPVRTGLDRVTESAYAGLFAGRRVGLLVNQTAVDRRGRPAVAVLRALPGVTVTALFVPEHGLRGRVAAGAAVADGVDPVSGLPVRSLYRAEGEPVAPDLHDVDVLVFDMQDVGVRCYTYVSTLALALRAAAAQGRRFVVLDRPNPRGGLEVTGPVLDPHLASFVGMFPVPVIHGLTVGEYARLMAARGWLGVDVRAALRVVPLAGWSREMTDADTGLRFVAPSPNLPDRATVSLYPATVWLEGTNVSEGRGTDRPFRQFGAPWLDGRRLAAALNACGLPGVRFRAVDFTPTASKHAGVLCHGVSLESTGPAACEPVACGLRILEALYRQAPERLQWRLPHLDHLWGTTAVRQAITAGRDLAPLLAQWEQDAARFRGSVEPVLLY